MAEHERAVFAAEVHTVSFAERENLAVLAWFDVPHPRAVAVGLEAIFPHLPERIPIDVPLIVFAADGGAGRDRAVDEDGRHADTCGALVEMVTDATFVGSEVAFAGIRDMTSRFAFSGNEIHQVAELVVIKQQLGIGGSPPHRVDAEHAPVANAQTP